MSERIYRFLTNLPAEHDATEPEVEVHFSFDPGEPARLHERDGSGYPGSAPTLEIFSVLKRGREIKHTLPLAVINELEALASGFLSELVRAEQ